MAKAKSIQPLDGGYDGYIETLDKVRDYVEGEQPRMRDGLVGWYRQEFDAAENAARPYINSLFRCGLLKDGSTHVECTFPRRRNQAQRIIEIIDNNIVFILDMLHSASAGASEEELHDVGKSKHGLGPKSNVNQIWWRRGWLQSAGMLERRDGLMFPTGAGLELLRNHGFDMSNSSAGDRKGPINSAEFGGRGEGLEHKTLKELVHENCGKILRTVRGRRVTVKDCQMEYELPSGDRVDVSAWDQEPVCWHIEVKSKISSPADVERGIYQCVKYKAVAEAVERVAPRKGRTVKSILVVEKDLPADLDDLAKELRIYVHRISVDMQRTLDRQRRDKQRR